MRTLDRAICKLREKTNPWMSGRRRSLLVQEDFSIISNNCWAGSVYRYFGLEYSSPTAGLYFFPEDYLRFIYRLRYYLSLSINFIPTSASKHYEELLKKNEGSVLVGVIDDIEVIFLHYATKDEAESKWRRRASRVNWNNLFIKFSEMNGCDMSQIEQFDALPFKNKLCFTSKELPALKSTVCLPGSEPEVGILNDTDQFNKGFDLVAWLNSVPERYEIDMTGISR